MKLGIKVGLQKQSFSDLEQTNTSYCEVWFNINDVSRYDPLFEFLKKKKIDVGLHFWGCLADNTWTNFAYPDTALINETLTLMRKTIDIAAKNRFQYVNIHPGTRTKTTIDLAAGLVRPCTNPVDLQTAESLFLEHATALHEYAKNRSVVFTVETVPPYEVKSWYDPNGRLEPINSYELGIETILKAADHKLWIANDLCHTAANTVSNHRTEIATFVTDVTKKLFSQTRLVHVGFLVPPYNGTDFHDHLDNPLLDTDKAVPNNQELKQLLQLFKNRDDVWAIVEPANDHPKNYFLLQKLVDAQ